ncbi:MAG: glycosyltransferase [bacterium]
MPRIALVVPYFPPEAGGGVFRALKLVPHLTRHGWDPEIFTVENPGIATDTTLLDEIDPQLPVHRVYANAALRLQRGPFRKFGFAFDALGLSATSADQWDQLAQQLVESHREAPFDLIFSTSPPPASHRAVLAALDQLKPESRPPWVADFRDPWRRGFTYRPASDAEASLDVRDEGRVLLNATRVTTTVHTSMLASMMEHSLTTERLVWIPNGFDPEDLVGLPPAPAPPTVPTAANPLRFGYAGSLYGAYNLDLFLQGLAQLLEVRSEWRAGVRLELFGPRSKQTVELIKRRQLEDVVEMHGYMAHKAVLRALAACHWVLVTMPQDPRALDSVPGKLYEYLAARFPVLAFASADGAIAKLLHETQGGGLITTLDPAEVAADLATLVQSGVQPTAGAPPPGFASFQARYARPALAAEFVRVFTDALHANLPSERA